MSTTRASAFLCWLCALLGLLVVWDAQSAAPGGIFPHTAAMVFIGKAGAALFVLAAVGLHICEFFQRRGRS